MLNVIRGSGKKDGMYAGIKPSGGIAEPGDALGYFLLAKAVMGEDYISKETVPDRCEPARR